MSGFNSEDIADWAKRHLMLGSHLLFDGLACFRPTTIVNCHDWDDVTDGNRPIDLSQF